MPIRINLIFWGTEVSRRTPLSDRLKYLYFVFFVIFKENVIFFAYESKIVFYYWQDFFPSSILILYLYLTLKNVKLQNKAIHCALSLAYKMSLIETRPNEYFFYLKPVYYKFVPQFYLFNCYVSVLNFLWRHLSRKCDELVGNWTSR